ncbi:MAG: hypothetical protein K0R88_2515 [Solirubrobacterales bacterium]|nr:hypothetical protein [Solirubrobacterales bacterium]
MTPIAQTPTTVSHEARSRDTAAIVADVPDRNAENGPTVADAEVAVARLTAMSSDLRGCVILAADGSALAASGELEPWERAAREVLAAADAAAGEPASHAHVGTEDGEVFAVRHRGFALIAASDRFALASLMLSDMRAVLRELARAPGAAPARDARAKAA